MKYLCIFLFVAAVFTNKVSAQEILYLKLDTTSQNQSMASEWLLSPTTQKYYNGVAYYHELYNGILIRMNCDDKDLLYQENIPISQLPFNLKTIEELDILLRGKSDAIQSAFWETKKIILVQISPSGQTFALMKVTLHENPSSGKVSSTQE